MLKAKSKHRSSRRPARAKTYRVIPGHGVACPGCGRPTQVRKHVAITKKHLRQPYYFDRWFYCCNPRCFVTLHVAEEFKVRRQTPCMTQS